jgi:hypothetical protein
MVSIPTGLINTFSPFILEVRSLTVLPRIQCLDAQLFGCFASTNRGADRGIPDNHGFQEVQTLNLMHKEKEDDGKDDSEMHR